MYIHLHEIVLRPAPTMAGPRRRRGPAMFAGRAKAAASPSSIMISIVIIIIIIIISIIYNNTDPRQQMCSPSSLIFPGYSTWCHSAAQESPSSCILWFVTGACMYAPPPIGSPYVYRHSSTAVSFTS